MYAKQETCDLKYVTNQAMDYSGRFHVTGGTQLMSCMTVLFINFIHNRDHHNTCYKMHKNL